MMEYGVLALCVYCASSYLLLRFPQLIHRKRSVPKLFKVKTIAHRGGRMEHAENTIEAFSNSLQLVDMLELDIWFTRDKQVVVFHDGTFARMCGGLDGHVNDTDYKDLPSVLASCAGPFLQGGNRTSNMSSKAEAGTRRRRDGGSVVKYRIPLLSEVLDLVKQAGKSVLIEFKDKDPALIPQVYAMVSEKQMQSSVVWFSLNSAVNRRLRGFGQELERQGEEALPLISSVQEVVLLLGGSAAFLAGSSRCFWLPHHKCPGPQRPAPVCRQAPFPAACSRAAVVFELGSRRGQCAVGSQTVQAPGQERPPSLVSWR
eukprot:CAMPEP_0175173676 /NCGR_PEP_ID=MMETSP0087-20121206/32189_1 /TAXON_ID=136419 /ORGANISM="Unknown Unknown, Strain D1" /LENGTH=314 /DNA_ID=CAMNT_0016465021 /DNA_START=42 /DNA_END=986 /DNA_ORIENTATION=+